MKKELKVITAFGVILFSTLSFANTPFVTVPVTGIFQNLTNSDLIVHYSTCSGQLMGQWKCTPAQSLQLGPKSSNYQNPVVVDLDTLNEVGSINILSVSDPKNHIYQNFGSGCAVSGAYQSNVQPGVLTFSSLVDNSNLIICTPGGTRR